MKISILLRKIYKLTLPYCPGYHNLCVAMRSLFADKYDWISRLPVKPGIIASVKLPVAEFSMCCPERCSIAKKFFWTNGRREPAEDRIALELFLKFVGESEVVFDIGSNSGLFALAAAKHNSKAENVAFDILVEAHNIFLENIKLNGLEGKIDARLNGIGAKGVFNSPVKKISSEMPTSLSVEDSVANGDSTSVPILTLDEICVPKYLGKKACFKIDVEGTEVDIFENGKETLEKIRPVMVCEVLMRARDYERYDKILDDFSYRKFLITAEGLEEYEHIVPNPKYKDWFFIVDESFDPNTIKLDKIFS
ncbi:FkbM family methyltransferase [Maridesulfovibrio sp.]|uniref:FkbM family methyltransferase n=1 Tax=Maridesulfovibrio sp. TaxID=2795000 RepID=UPI0029C9F33D|nr:FkbM family methyltransferase [Maridesulfovibrio sp.]